jgi:hypothetical protein
MRMRSDLWWRATIVISVAIMALDDALTPIRSHYKVEIWLIVMFIDIALTVLLNRPRNLGEKLRMVGWLTACFLFVYSIVWAATEIALHHTFPPQVSLYPFGIAMSDFWFFMMGLLGAWMLYVFQGDD